MTLIGIPIIFIMISIFEMSRGMWIYDTVAHASREGIRFAIVHGYNCVNTPPVTNDCAKTIADVAAVIKSTGVGLELNTTTIRFTAPSPGGAVVTCTLAAVGGCSGITTIWPPVGNNTVGTIVQIDVTTQFRSALSMFWPGAGKVDFSTVNLGATSVDAVQF